MVRSVLFISGLSLLSACSDPLAGFDRLLDVDVPAGAQSAPAALPTSDEVAREGFFGTQAADAPADLVDPQNATLAAQSQTPKKRGLLGLFTKSEPVSETAEDIAVAEALDGAAAADSIAENPLPLEIAALAPEATPQTTPDTAPKRKGLLGLLSPAPKDAAPASDIARTGADARDVPVGTVLAFGEIARVCEAKGGALGKRVGEASGKKFSLYDTAPGTIAARTFYIKGFSDNCARQITAATVVLSEASTYEQFRFGLASQHLPLGETDAAYARIKRQTCGASKNKPCGSKIKQLDRSTFFISSYRDLGQTGSWSELLIHNGDVVAAATKSY